MKKGAGNAAPLVCLAPAIDDQIDRDIESSQLSAEPPVLLPATREIGLDHQQVQIAVRPGLAPCTRPEEDDVRVGGGRGEAAPGLLNQSLIGNRHNVRSVVATRDGRHQTASTDAKNPWTEPMPGR